MAETDKNSLSREGSESLAEIKAVQGRVEVTRADGTVVNAKTGVKLNDGDTVQSSGSSVAILDFGAIGLVTLGHDQRVTLDQALLRLLEQKEEEGSLEEGVNFEALARAIESGQEIDELLPAAAAGEEGAPNAAEAAPSGPVRLQLTAEQVRPTSGFETTGFTLASSESSLPDGDALSSQFLTAAANSQPVTSGLAAIAVNEDESFVLDITSAFSDADEEQTLSFEVEGLPDSLSFDPLTGTISGTPTNDDAFNGDGTYTITVTASDDSGASNNTTSATFDLQVNNVNDAPIVDAPLVLESINEDSSLTIPVATLLANASDIDQGDVLSVTNVSLTSGSGSITQDADGNYVFVPTADWNGDVEFSFDVIDGNGGLVQNSATFTVLPVNDAPIAQADGPVSTTTNTALTIDLLANDTDIDGDTLTIVSATATNGTVSIAGDGSVIYTPNANFFGDDLIQYEITDGQGGSAQSTAQISVIYNPGVVSINDLGTLDDSTPVFSGTSANIVGDLTLNVNGNTFVVTPEADGSWSFELPDTFALPDGDFVVSVSGLDDIGNQAEASDAFSIDALLPQVSITDLQVLNDSTPTFSGTSANTDGDLILQVNGVSYALTPDANGDWSFTLPDSDALIDGDYTATIVGTDAAGNSASASDDFVVDSAAPSVSIQDIEIADTPLPTFSGGSANTDGDLTLTVNGVSYLVTPDANGDWSFTLPPGNELPDGSYIATIEGQDAQGNQASASDAFVVDAIDDAPLVTGEFTGVVTEGDLGDISQTSGTIAINDPDSNQSPSFADTTEVGSFGTLTLENGVWTYTLNQAAVQNLDAGDLLNDFVTLTASDGTSQTIQISINGTEDAPVISGTFSGSVSEADIGDVSQVSGTIAISDVDDGDNPVFADTVVQGQYGSLALANGVWTYTLDQAQVQDLGQGDVLQDSILLSASDGSTQAITITINGTNDAPVVVGAAQSTEENTAFNAIVPAASDVDGAVSFFSLVNDVDQGSLIFNDDGSYSFDPELAFDSLAAGETQEVSFAYTATDDQGAISEPAVITITVVGSNDAPQAVSAALNTSEQNILSASVPPAVDIDGSIASFDLLDSVDEGALTFNPDGSFEFNPSSDFDDLAVGESREVSFTYTATDDQGAVSAPATITITVTGTNDVPIAVAATETTEENTVLNASVPQVTDADGTVVSFALENTVLEGALTFNDDGSYSFDPGAAFDDLTDGESREVSFTYTATDDQGGVSAPATVIITVTGTNDAPVAVAATETTEENTVLNASVPAATDVDGTIASFTLANNVADGTLIFNNDGSYSFDPGTAFDDLAVGESRDVSFTYTATDDQGSVSAPATITITVTGTNDAPVAVAAAETTEENTVLNASVPAASDVDGTIASFTLVNSVAEGTLTFNDDGSYSFDPGTAFDDLAVDESREVSFTYTATDDQGAASAPATITITVTGTNDAPVAVAAAETTEENTVLNASVPAASDVDGSIESFALVNDVSEGTLTFNDDGSYSFDPGTAFDDLAVNESREVSFIYTATDDQGAVSAPATVTITVTGTNDAPVAVAAAETTEENTVLNASVPAATDVDGTIASFTLANDVAEGTLTFNDDGSYSFDPGTAFDDLADGESRDVSFTYTATDDQGAVSAPVTVVITVTGTNDAPVAAAATETTEENTVLNASVPAATDVDGTIATFTLVNNVAEGALTFNDDGSYSFDPGTAFDDLAVDESREVSFTYTATDDQGAVSAPATITITVTGTNDAPVAAAATETTEENTVLNASVPAATDVDGAIASFALVNNVAEGTLTFNGDGSYTFDPGTAFDDLADGESREVSFTYTATDDQGAVSAPATVTITVTGTNDAPVAAAAAETTEENTVLNASVPAASDVDDTIASFTLVNSVAEGTLTFNDDGSYSFDPGTAFDDLAVDESREVSFTYTATDDQGAVSAPATVVITVTGTNDAPVAVAAAETTEENTVLNASVPAATDVDGTIASFTLANDVAEGTLTFNDDGSYSFDPGTAFDDLADGESRDVSFTYTATDDQGAVSAPVTVVITVTGTNDAPVAAAATETTEENTVLNASVPAATDVDGTIATFTLVNNVAEGALTFNDDGSYSFDPGTAFDDLAVDESREVSFTYTATDDQGAVSSPATVTITVTGTNDAPIAESFVASVGENSTLNAQLVGSDAEGDVSFAVEGDIPDGLILDSDGSFIFNPGDEFDTLNSGESQDVEFTFLVTDEDGESTSETATITVTGVTDTQPPAITVTSAGINQESEFSPVAFTAEAFPFGNLDSEDDANGIDPSNVTLSGVNEISLSFVSESAGFSNSIGVYQVNEAGEIVSAQIIWENGNTVPAGDVVTFTTTTDAELGFFIIPNGANTFRDELEALSNGQGVIRFEDAAGNLATVDTNGATLRFYPDGDENVPLGAPSQPNRPAFLSGSSNLNPDGSTRVASGLLDANDPTQLLIGFEDLTDFDLTDFLFSLSIQSSDFNTSDILSDLDIQDDGATLSSAQVQISLGRASDQLVLSDDLQARAAAEGLSIDIDPVSRTVNIDGDAGIDIYTELLSGVQIGSVEDLGDDPREVTFTVVDEDGLSSNVANVQLNADPSYDFSEDDLLLADGSNPTEGGEGNDILIATEESNIFTWNAGDQGDSSAPSQDVVLGFELGVGGDVLDFADLLQGESQDATTLDDFLGFSSDGTDTTISISVDGSGDVTQEVVLQGVDLTLLGSDQQIIQQLLSDGNLATD